MQSGATKLNKAREPWSLGEEESERCPCGLFKTPQRIQPFLKQLQSRKSAINLRRGIFADWRSSWLSPLLHFLSCFFFFFWTNKQSHFCESTDDFLFLTTHTLYGCLSNISATSNSDVSWILFLLILCFYTLLNLDCALCVCLGVNWGVLCNFLKNESSASVPVLFHWILFGLVQKCWFNTQLLTIYDCIFPTSAIY